VILLMLILCYALVDLSHIPDLITPFTNMVNDIFWSDYNAILNLMLDRTNGSELKGKWKGKLTTASTPKPCKLLYDLLDININASTRNPYHNIHTVNHLINPQTLIFINGKVSIFFSYVSNCLTNHLFKMQFSS
jgi:hypothetical protein